MNNIITNDENVKKELLEYSGNILIIANAGSGKTTFLAEKLTYDAEKMKNYQKLAAITFTRNATDEIKNKLVDIPENVDVLTIDSFIDKEIIIPFFYQRYELSPFKPTHCKGKTLQFSFYNKHKFNSFEDGIKQIEQKGIFGTYESTISRKGKNFKCEVALDIIKNTASAGEYLKYKFKTLYIDEFQDCDYSMNVLFMYLKEKLGIILFIVGDNKQSIYQWRGASPKYINDLWKNKNDFKKERFVGNFRSTPKIVDFSLALTPDVEIDFINKKGSILYFNTKKDALKENIIKYLLENRYIDTKETNYFLIGNNSHIEKTTTQLDNLFPKKFDYIRKNPFIECINNNFLNSLAQYYFLEYFSEYDVLNNLYPQYNDDFRRELLKKMKRFCKNPNCSIIEDIASYLDISIEKLESQILVETLADVENRKLFDTSSLSNNLLMTTHSSKGLAADTVVVFVEYLFDWNNHKLKFEDHYVAITRAKSKIILIDSGTNYIDNINELLSRNNGTFSFDDFAEIKDI